MKAILSGEPLKPTIESLRAHFSNARFLSPPPIDNPDSLAFRKKVEEQGSYAAILIPIINGKDGLEVLLTRRADHLRNHAGQMSFPGGRIEQHDDSHIAAALRETEEEIGLPADRTEIIGHLGDYYSVTNYCITPVIGIIHGEFELTVDPNEVAEIIHVPLDYLMNPAVFELDESVYDSIMRRYYSTYYGKHRIWGVSAGIIIALYKSLAQTHLRGNP